MFLLLKNKVFGPAGSRWRKKPADPNWLSQEEAQAVGLPPGTRLRPETRPYSLTLGDFERIARDICEIPPFPRAAMLLLRVLDRDDCSAKSVAEVIANEPVLAAQTLRVANSAASGLRGEVQSITQAVAYLGLSFIKTLILKLELARVIGCVGFEGYDPQRLWTHCVAVARVAEILARRISDAEPELASTAGLLHDIGKLAINRRFPDKVGQLWSPELNDLSLLERERRLFGADHAAIGGCLAVKWGLPNDLVEIIRMHHQPQSSNNLRPAVRTTLQVVHVANEWVKYRHAYCDCMEIDSIRSELLSPVGLGKSIDDALDVEVERAIQQALQVCEAPVCVHPKEQPEVS